MYSGGLPAMNDLGKEGWELVAVTQQSNYTYCYYKRPMP